MSSQPVYFQNVHTQSTTTGDMYLTIQLPVTPSGQVGLWEFNGLLYSYLLDRQQAVLFYLLVTQQTLLFLAEINFTK